MTSLLLLKGLSVHNLAVCAAEFLAAIVHNLSVLVENVDLASVRHNGTGLLHVHLLLLLLQVMIVVMNINRLVFEARRNLRFSLLRGVHCVHYLLVLVLH